MILGFGACDTPSSEQEKKEVLTLEEIPVLLQRNEKIQLGKEWDDMQNQYGTYRSQLVEGQNEAAIRLAQLFTIEARITGEHGHYYPAALDLMDWYLEQTPKNQDLKFQALSTKASVLLSQHEFKEALSVAKEAVALNPYNAQIYGALVDAYVELGQYKEAVKVADRMVAIRPDLRSYARVSYLREIYGQPQEAIDAMEMAVAAGYPGLEETAWTRLTLGNLYEKYGSPEQAKAQYEIILANRPDYPFAVAALANMAFQNKDYPQTKELLDEAITSIPEFGFYEQLAKMYLATNQKVKFQGTWDEILVMLQDDVDNGHNMNMEYAALYRDLQKDYNKALSFAKKEYEKRPENIQVNLLMADLYFKQGNEAEANYHLSKAQITGSKDPELMGLQQSLAFNE